MFFYTIFNYKNYIVIMKTQDSMEVFIPFVPRCISSSFISNVFEQQLFGKVIEINLHDKKIKTNSKVRSAKHNYAFIKIQLFDTTAGNNMRRNILNNQNTYMMCEYKEHVIHWQVKPYLNVQDRMERGFELHLKNEETKKENLPEWYNCPVIPMVELFKSKKEKLSLVIPDENIVPPLNRGQMAPRTTSFFDNYAEKIQIAVDYEDIERLINVERKNYEKMLETN